MPRSLPALALISLVSILASGCGEREPVQANEPPPQRPIVAHVSGQLRVGHFSPRANDFSDKVTLHLVKEIDDVALGLLQPHYDLMLEYLQRQDSDEIERLENALSALKANVPKPITETFPAIGRTTTSSQELYDGFSNRIQHFDLSELDEQLKRLRERMLIIMREKEGIRQSRSTVSPQALSQALADSLWIEALSGHLSQMEEVLTAYRKVVADSIETRVATHQEKDLPVLRNALLRFPAGSAPLSSDDSFSFEAEQDGSLVVEIVLEGVTFLLLANDNPFEVSTTDYSVTLGESLQP